MESATPLHMFRELAHGFCRNGAALASSKRSFGFLDGGQDFQTGALALLPQREGFLYCVFLAQEPSALDRLADKGLLVGSKMDFHVSRGRVRKEGGKRGFGRCGK
jgi:hypothetical protein